MVRPEERGAHEEARRLADDLERSSERERLGLTKYAVSTRSGLSQQMIGYVERGMRNPSLETVVRLAAGLGVDLSEIIKLAYKHVAKEVATRRL